VCGASGKARTGAPLWVIRFDGNSATLLATPKDFSGWVFAVLPAMSHGYPVIVTGWHMSARETDLTYLRFDGKLYRRIAAATLATDDDGKGKVVAQVQKP